jgi:hypothetical protein
MSEFTQSFNRYAYCLNNPLIYTDPSGELIFSLLAGIFCPALIPAAFQLDMAWMNGGFSSMMNGKSFWSGAGKGLLTGAVTAGLGYIAPLGTSWVGSTIWGAAVGTVASVGSVWASGSNDYSNVWIGTVTGGVFGFMDSQEVGNMNKGQGFRSNDEVLSRFVANGNHQGALDYFGFEGKYDPKAGNSHFDPNDGSIHINNNAFSKNYDYLRAIYTEELFHSKDYLISKSKAPDWMRNEPNLELRERLLHNYEEWRAQNYLYKNQGIYFKSGVNWIERIDYYGFESLISETFFQNKWWHFIYKLQRRW